MFGCCVCICVCVWGGGGGRVSKFHKYLYGKEFVVKTDHQPLLFLHNAQAKNSRVLRWAMSLQPYCCILPYIPRRDNVGLTTSVGSVYCNCQWSEIKLEVCMLCCSLYNIRSHSEGTGAGCHGITVMGIMVESDA